ncbi:succinate dehydrogenase [Actinorhabdospora filicis]|uniref:Succinate dehydrogenase n=1 Tax=Actinorhabdospora filicis TaxID=1785913 RepID=A0A9W6W8R6_9ACTN|nr:succinate dehydrogenase cytochrome b subunit [Actinorhabdospora filicis]GLZ77839.1 succinate dehydrogenase [Actinorhabdospora filicis]
MDLATRRVVNTTVGKKAVMAVTGVILVLFLIAHMTGNLKIFLSTESFDHYAHWLRTIGEPLLPYSWFLWIQRIVLLAAVIGHIWSATSLALKAKAARPVKYAHRRPVKGSYAARTMRWGGVIIVLFVVYHILDLTTGHLNPVGDSSRPAGNLIADFAPGRWYVTLFYVVAVLTLAFHLRHGVFSALRTLGQQTQTGERRAKAVALVVAVVIAVGFLAVPLSITTGLIK